MLILLLVLLASLMPAAHGQAQSTRSPWQTLSSAVFSVYYQKGDSVNARTILTILEKEFPSLSSELGIKPTSPIGIYIAPSRISFNRLTGGAIPHWGEAVADARKQIIIVKSPRWFRSNNRPRTLLTHELVHILVGIATNNATLPRWLNEGLAIYISGETEYADGREIAHARFSDQLIPLQQIDAMFAFEQFQAHLAYQQAFSAISYLVETYGHTALSALLQSVRRERNFERAFQKTFAVSTQRFEQDWRAWLEKKYRYTFLVDFEYWLWLVIVLLFFAAFLMVQRRKRRKLAEWEQSEHTSGEPPDSASEN